MLTRQTKPEPQIALPQAKAEDHESSNSSKNIYDDVHPSVLSFSQLKNEQKADETKDEKDRKEKAPEAKIENAPDSIVNDDGTFTLSAAFTLSMLSGVPIETILAAKIGIKERGLTFPWYNAKKGGGAITVGRTIYMTENFFDRTGYYHYKAKDKNTGLKYDENTSYGNEPIQWLYLLAHEVRHLVQGEAFGTDAVGTAKYLLKFTELYITHFGHNGASLEKTADEGMYVFRALFVTGGALNADAAFVESLFKDAKTDDVDRLKQLATLFDKPEFIKKINEARTTFQTDNAKALKSEKEILDDAKEERDQRKIKVFINKSEQ